MIENEEITLVLKMASIKSVFKLKLSEIKEKGDFFIFDLNILRVFYFFS